MASCTETQFIGEILAELSGYVRGRYADRTSVEVTSKSEPNDLLTEVDLTVQHRAMERLAQVYPGDLFIAEEAGMSRLPDDAPPRAWLMDPIDGTQNFVRGIFPSFGISLAFTVNGEVVAGGVSLAIPGDLFLAERGSGATRNGRPLHVSNVALLEESRVEVDFGGPPVRERTLAAATPLLRHAGQIRCHCAAVVGLCSVASGDMDAFIHVSLNPWDYAAGMIICQEAGGTVTRLNGAIIHPFDGLPGVLATNGLIHDQFVAAIVPNGA